MGIKSFSFFTSASKVAAEDFGVLEGLLYSRLCMTRQVSNESYVRAGNVNGAIHTLRKRYVNNILDSMSVGESMELLMRINSLRTTMMRTYAIDNDSMDMLIERMLDNVRFAEQAIYGRKWCPISNDLLASSRFLVAKFHILIGVRNEIAHAGRERYEKMVQNDRTLLSKLDTSAISTRMAILEREIDMVNEEMGTVSLKLGPLLIRELDRMNAELDQLREVYLRREMLHRSNKRKHESEEVKGKCLDTQSLNSIQTAHSAVRAANNAAKRAKTEEIELRNELKCRMGISQNAPQKKLAEAAMKAPALREQSISTLDHFDRVQRGYA